MPVPGFNRPGDGGGGLKLGDKLKFVANLNAKNQPSTMADSVAILINKVANLGYVGSKRWASGTALAGSSATTFKDYVGSSLNLYQVTVSGLTFKPSVIDFWYDTYTGGHYNVDRKYGSKNIFRVEAQSNTYIVSMDDAPASVTNSGFTVGVPTGAGGTIHWIAYE